jgi:hypothetical protein
MGGDNGQGNYSNDVRLAVVQDDGKIGKFDKDNEQFVNPRWGHGSIFYRNRLYIFGGTVKERYGEY